MANGKFSEAFVYLAAVPLSLGSTFPPLHPEEAGLLALLCAMASLKHGELKAIWDIPTCSLALESFPVVRNALDALVCGEFSKAANLYASLRPVIHCDPTGSFVFSSLARSLSVNSLLHYAAPFSRFTLSSAATAVGHSTSTIADTKLVEYQVYTALVAGRMRGKINGADGSVSAWVPDEQSRVVSAVRENVECFLTGTSCALLRVALQKVEQEAKSKRGGGAMNRWGRMGRGMKGRETGGGGGGGGGGTAEVDTPHTEMDKNAGGAVQVGGLLGESTGNREMGGGGEPFVSGSKLEEEEGGEQEEGEETDVEFDAALVYRSGPLEGNNTIPSSFSYSMEEEEAEEEEGGSGGGGNADAPSAVRIPPENAFLSSLGGDAYG